MAYVQGFVLAVPVANRAAYLAMAEQAWPLFREFGAQSMAECWEDDVPDGKLTSFPMAVKKRDDEAVVFSWIMWSDKASHDQGMAALMQDPRWAAMTAESMPFDGQRMIFGGFEVAFAS
ncbi:MAG: DUF1428 domain-containing protein [Burkholderiaceae bacterium]|nr:DUF1428 domain-containing protein [Burkholderiaceae bacterium]